jgi:hypothetical protein
VIDGKIRSEHRFDDSRQIKKAHGFVSLFLFSCAAAPACEFVAQLSHEHRVYLHVQVICTHAFFGRNTAASS